MIDKKLLLLATPPAIIYGVAGYLGILWLALAMLAIPLVMVIATIVMVVRYVIKNRSEVTGEIK